MRQIYFVEKGLLWSVVLASWCLLLSRLPICSFRLPSWLRCSDRRRYSRLAQPCRLSSFLSCPRPLRAEGDYWRRKADFGRGTRLATCHRLESKQSQGESGLGSSTHHPDRGS